MKNNIKKEVIFRIILFSFFILVLSGFASAASVTVCSSGCNYTSIQNAINNTSAGDIISVLAGTYNENITVNVSVVLNGSAHPTIYGGFNISASNVELYGFNITDGLGWDTDGTGTTGAYRIGIFISSSNNSIHNNIINNITAIDGDTGDSGGIGGIGVGIYFSGSSNNNITNNNITNIHGGIGGAGGSFATGGNGGIGSGIYLTNSMSNNISLNNISNIYCGQGGDGDNGGVAAPGGTGDRK